MTKENVDKLLSEYRLNEARIEHLQVQADRLTRVISYLKENAIDVSYGTTQKFTLMPGGKGGVPASKVEKLALMLADGEMPSEIKQAEKELEDIIVELNEKKDAVSFVNAWMKGLREAERYVLTSHVIDGMVWREVMHGYNFKFGVDYSRTALKQILSKAQNKVYRIAC